MIPSPEGMLPQPFFTSQSGYVSDGMSTLFPPDVATPASDQFDDMTYPGSEVTVINRVSEPSSSYWRQGGGCFLVPNNGYTMHSNAGHSDAQRNNYPFENESSSTLSCADDYQAQQRTNLTEDLRMSASLTFESGQPTTDAETIRDAAGTTCDCSGEMRLIDRESLVGPKKSTPPSPELSGRRHREHHHNSRNNFNRPSWSRKCHSKKILDGEERSPLPLSGRPKSKGAGEKTCNSHYLSEGDSYNRSHSRRRSKRSEHSRPRTRSRSPTCKVDQCSDCGYNTSRSWSSLLSPRHASSLPSFKKKLSGSPTGSRGHLRNHRRPINGLFGDNLTASRLEEHWSDGELQHESTNEGKMLRTIYPSRCGFICLSFSCIVGAACLFSPLSMLIIPFVLSFIANMRKQSDENEDFFAPSALFSLNNPVIFNQKSELLRISCSSQCEADLLSLSVKFIILSITTWKLYMLPVICVYQRLTIHPISMSAFFNRKLRNGCYKMEQKALNPDRLSPYPTDKPFALTLSVNFLSFGATCAFWVVFVARWMYKDSVFLQNTMQPTADGPFGALHGMQTRRSSAEHDTDSDASHLAYSSLVSFVLTLTDTQLILHMAGLILHAAQCLISRGAVFVIHVIRSPDGHSKSFRIARGSLHSVATELLHRYIIEFPLYDAQAASAPFRYTRLTSGEFSRCPMRSCASRKQSVSGLTPSEQEYQLKRCSSTGSSFKFYSLDCPNGDPSKSAEATSFENLTGSEATGDQGRNVNALCADYYHSQAEFEVAQRKRWMRLLVVTEKAFAAVEALVPDGVLMAGYKSPLTPRQAAQIIFPKVAVPLQKYLRLTRLQHLHPPDNILARLTAQLDQATATATALGAVIGNGTFELPPPFAAAFLSVYRLGEPFISVLNGFAPVGAGALTNAPTGKRPISCCRNTSDVPLSTHDSRRQPHLVQSWCLYTDTPGGATRPLQSGARFNLCRAGVTLTCTVHSETLFQLIMPLRGQTGPWPHGTQTTIDANRSNTKSPPRTFLPL